MTLEELAKAIEARIAEVEDERERAMGVTDDMDEDEAAAAFDEHWANADSGDYEDDDLSVGQVEGLTWVLERIREALAPR
jgi:hypothetical protein